jgi:hypothetical protein
MMRVNRKSLSPLAYHLSVTPPNDQRGGHTGTVVSVQTSSRFASFRYALSVDEHVEGHTIYLKVRGLITPSLDLPASGPAEFTKEYEGLHGRYRFIVEGLDGSKIAKTIDIP